MSDSIIRMTIDALWLVLLLSAPPIVAASAVGLLVALVQAATQLQEQTLQYTLKFFAIVATIFLTASLLAGKKATGTNFDLSYEADRCTYFVSHSWRDHGRRKVAMLREFLFLQTLVGRMLVICLVLATFLLPFGFALLGFFPDDLPWWAAYVPSAIPIGLLVLTLLWIPLSMLSLLPGRLTPWALKTSVAPGGTSDSSSTKIAPLALRSLTT